MDKLIYTALSGATSVLHRQENLAHNLANVSTPGYRQVAAAFRAVPDQPGALGTRVFAVETTGGANLAPGPVQHTGRKLDIAVRGEGWIALAGADGAEAYTRNGALHLDARGQLIGSNGLAVRGNDGPIVVPAGAEPHIAADGTVSALLPGQGAAEAQVLGRIKLVNPPAATLTRGADGLFRTPKPAPAAAEVSLGVGALEGSNANPVESMVGMIGAARAFEMHMKLLQSAEANARSAGQLLQAGG